MNAKKVLRIIGRGLVILLLLTVLLLLVTATVYHIRLNRVEKQLREAGYCNPVSVGDHALNLYACGNENGRHRIIALAGWGDGEMLLGWREMTADLEKENRVIFLDRAGYGFSDDSKQEMTPGNVVADYRAALQNAGIEAPYVLMAHSLGGLYATYWESKYPDEIEAVVLVDGSPCYDNSADEPLGGGMAASLMPLTEKLGLAPFVIRSGYGDLLQRLPEEQSVQAVYLMSKTLGARAAADEMNRLDADVGLVWREMQPTAIPKLYISALYAYRTKEDLIENGLTADVLLNGWVSPSMKDAGEDAIYEEALRQIAKCRTEWAEPYYEKLGSCEVAELPGDHVIFLDQPDACRSLVTAFVERLDGSR